MRKSVSQMSEEEYQEYARSLDRRIALWGFMYDLHPIPLILLILIVCGVYSCCGWCRP